MHAAYRWLPPRRAASDASVGGLCASLPTLDAAADKGLAGSVQRRLLSKRRKIAEQDGRGGSLHRILTTPADNFAVS